MQKAMISLGTQLFIGVARPMPELMQPIENTDGKKGTLVKPQGGLWTSSWDAKECNSQWAEWCIGEEFGNVYEQYWWLLTPQAEVRIAVVDSLFDLSHLLDRYPRRFTGRLASLNDPSMSRWLDYEALSQDFDAIHLTSNGQHHTRLTHPDSLYGWDCESTVWFRWCFEQVEQVKH